MFQASQLTRKRLEGYAKQQLAECNGKIFEYKIVMTEDQDDVYVSGNCSIIDINYDSLIHCDIYMIMDIDTKNEYVIDSFHILLKEKKG